MSDPAPPSDDLRKNALWASTLVVLALLFADGITALTAAAALLSVLGGIVGYGYARFK